MQTAVLVGVADVVVLVVGETVVVVVVGGTEEVVVVVVVGGTEEEEEEVVVWVGVVLEDELVGAVPEPVELNDPTYAL